MRTLLLSSAAVLVVTASSAIAADLPAYEPVAPAAPVADIFTWSGFYAGIHAGGAWGGHDDGESGCDSFRNITGEGGGDPTFDSADDIVDVPADGFGGFEDAGMEGCFDGDIDDGPDTGTTLPTFNLDGDYVAFESGGSDDDDINWLLGAQVGINAQYGRLVLGLEADASWLGGDDDGEDLSFSYFHEYDDGSDELEDYEGTGTVSTGGGLDWLATFRGRIGGAFGAEGRLLAYATGGIAVAGVDDSWSVDFDDTGGVGDCDDCTFSGGDDDSHEVGFAVGAGAEYAFTNNVSFGAEYMYVGFDDDDGGSVTFNADEGRSFDVATGGGTDDLHIVRARLNWLFGPGS